LGEILKDVKLLVADDDFSNAEIIISFLKGLSNQVYYAPNGQVAYDLAIKKQPDLIIMDWQMPEMNGIESIKRLKSNELTMEIPIIMATGVMTSVDNLKQALEAGAMDFLRKPFNRVEFEARTESALRIIKQHRQLLDHKQRELSSMASFELQKNILLSDLLNQIKRLDKITKHVYATDIKLIEKKLKSQLDLDKSWDTFKLHFGEVHPNFFNKIDSQFPKLSINERRLCAYIKMGLDNFEIAKMKGASDTALKKAINRLKKKLSLDANDDIRSFIFNY